MKKFAVFLFICVFTLNTTMLAAKAGACKFENGGVSAPVKIVEKDLPPCHQKNSQAPQKQGGHCKGVCFCQHIKAQSFSMPVIKLSGVVLPFVKQTHTAEKPEFLAFTLALPHFRPPITLS